MNFDESMLEIQNSNEVCIVPRNKRAIREENLLSEHISVVAAYTASGKMFQRKTLPIY